MVCDELLLERCEQVIRDLYAPNKLEYKIFRALVVREDLPKFLGCANVSQMDLAEFEVTWVYISCCFLGFSVSDVYQL